MPKPKIRDEHVKMIRNGKSQLIPMTQIEVWVKDGHLEDSGWTFAPGAKEIYEEWQKETKRRRQLERKRPAVIQRDPGFADVSRAVGQAAEAEVPGPIEDPEIPDVKDLKDPAAAEAPGSAVPAAEVTELLEE